MSIDREEGNIPDLIPLEQKIISRLSPKVQVMLKYRGMRHPIRKSMDVRWKTINIHYNEIEELIEKNRFFHLQPCPILLY